MNLVRLRTGAHGESHVADVARRHARSMPPGRPSLGRPVPGSAPVLAPSPWAGLVGP